jgi:hypothetical protein
MELMDRYLQAIRFWLPKAQRDDIIAEISEDFRSQIEDKEAELGRELNDGELEAILKQRGRPILVAQRYMPQQYLIGPVLFPIYQFVLKLVVLCYLAPWSLVWIGLMIFNPAYQSEHGGWSLLGALARFWSSFWVTAMIAVGVVTLVFAILERTQAADKLAQNWAPDKLPPVRDPNRIRRFDSIIEIVVGIIVLVWWMSALGFQIVFEFSGTRITLAPEWRLFLGGFLVLSVVNLLVSGTNLFRPCWTRPRACIRLATDCIGSALCCGLLKSAILVEIIAPNVPADNTLAVTNAINLWMSRSLPFAVIIGVILAIVRTLF